MILPVNYDSISSSERRVVREEYVKLQNGKCMYCDSLLSEPPPQRILDYDILWSLFPGGDRFLNHPVHLQHNHDTGMTEGAVHAYCNAVLWQYEGR